MAYAISGPTSMYTGAVNSPCRNAWAKSPLRRFHLFCTDSDKAHRKLVERTVGAKILYEKVLSLVLMGLANAQ
eukprot:scaffold7026_cov436-Pinguiococcus_pyrenoidosus.AAC.1